MQAARYHRAPLSRPLRLVSRSPSTLLRPVSIRQRLPTAVQAIPSLDQVPLEVLYAGGGAIAAALALVGYSVATQQPSTEQAPVAGEAGAAAPPPPPLPRENAVLVFGATGRTGRRIVQQLVGAGRTVVAAVRSADKAASVFGEAGLSEGRQQGGGILIFEAGVDVTDAATLTADLFAGVTQVVSALGPVYGRQPGGGFGYSDDMSPQRVDAAGLSNVAAAAAQHLPKPALTSELVLPMASGEDLAKWERLDDVIMGGQSDSALEPAADGSGAVWRGTLRVEGGGFCGARTTKLGLDLSAYTGIQLRVKGDGQTFKLNIKTADQEDVPESTYQATFDTSPEGDWTTVRLPWTSFVPVTRAQSDPAGAPLDPASISKLGLVLSRFEFNKYPNPNYRPGPFELAVSGGLSAYVAPKPQLLAIGSAGVERNALIGDDAEARKRDIPIVQLNPGGVLNWKYSGENAVRASGLAYTVLRCTGLDDTPDLVPALLEADQGDALSGKVTRAEAADLAVFALSSPDAVGKTFEVRRSEAADAQGKVMGPREYQRLLLKLSPDSHRWRVGLRPFPPAVPPPPPADAKRTEEILADPRVQAVAARDRAARGEEVAEALPAAGQSSGEEGEGAAVEGDKAKELVTA